jgi:hypothetical protein
MANERRLDPASYLRVSFSAAPFIGNVTALFLKWRGDPDTPHLLVSKSGGLLSHHYELLK